MTPVQKVVSEQEGRSKAGFFSLFEDKPLSLDRMATLQRKLAKRKPYIVFFTARSGSSYLADLLSKCYVAGRPGEFFNPSMLPRIVAAIEKRQPGSIGSVVDYMHWLLDHRSTRNGGFGLKATFPHYRPFVLTGLDRALFHDFSKFFLTRKNLVKQAVSLYVMTETKLSHRNKAVGAEVMEKVSQLSYDRERLRHWILHLWAQEESYRAYFKQLGQKVHPIDYQTFSEDPAGTVKMIAETAGISEPLQIQASDFQKVRGSKNDVLAEEFMEDKSNLGFLKEHGIPKSRTAGA